MTEGRFPPESTMKNRLYLETPCGRIGIVATDEAVTGIFFEGIPPHAATEPVDRTRQSDALEGHSSAATEETGKRTADATLEAADCGIPPLLAQAARELGEYFDGIRRTFTFPISLQGTPFQKEVWRALRSIPYGETRTYGQIAAQIGRPKAVRAVGMANHRNPLPIVVPCHRVVGADGSLTGYAGGLDIKTLLLRLEKQ